MSDFQKFWWTGVVVTFCAIQRDRKDGELVRHFTYDLLLNLALCYIAWPIFLGRAIRAALKR